MPSSIGRVAEVFSFVTNPDNERRWRRDVVEAQKTSAGPIGVGTMFRWMVAFMGRREMTVEVTAFEPDRLVVFTTRSATMPLRPTITYLLEAVDGGHRRFTRRASIEPSGLFRLMAPLMGGFLRKTNAKHVDDLKRVMEGTTSSVQ